MIRFALIGGGWRSEFYLRIATLLPTEFAVSAIYVRNADKRATLKERFAVPFVEGMEELLATDFDFVVSCVSKGNICDMLSALAGQGIPVLSETPIGTTPNEAAAMYAADPAWPVQVAEQYHLTPRSMAYKAIIDSGLLGEVHRVWLSECHDYHGVSLIRYLLGVGMEKPAIESTAFPDPVVHTRGRGGAEPERLVTPDEVLTLYRFGEKTGIYDFCREQYFSPIRQPVVHIKGTRGEILNTTCRYLDGGLAHRFELERVEFGQYENLDGMGLSAITGGGRLLYRAPFESARLSDEELAIATVLCKMKEFVASGRSFYSLREAAWDTALSLGVVLP